MTYQQLLKQRLSHLVATPSVSSTSAQWDMGNRGVIELLAVWLDQLGFATEIVDIPEYPQKANLIATLGSGPGGLVLAGHTDTVPYDASHWHQDPFKLTERDNRLYGLGSTDMKGFFPVVLAAIEPLLGNPIQQPLIILATADEESSMCGARTLAELGKPKARYAVIGEPTGLKPIRMHKGIMMESVHVQGMAGHSSDPHLGNNAMEVMHQVLTELMQLRGELQQRYQHSGFTVPHPTLNFGHIHGGDNPNRICGACELHFDLRPVPGMVIAELRTLINDRLQPIARATNTVITSGPLIDSVEPFEQHADSALVKVAEQLSGYGAESVAFATEASFFHQLGMETIVFGPGSIDNAHQPNEYIALDQLDPGINAIRQLVQKYCYEYHAD